jgi:23S rRNA pseudoU1915 N3-methylase RlmH
MAPNQDPYQQRVDNAFREYQWTLAAHPSDLSAIGFASNKWYALKTSLKSLSASIDPDTWERKVVEKVQRQFYYEEDHSQEFDQKIQQLKMLGDAIRQNPELLRLGFYAANPKLQDDGRIWFPDRVNPRLPAALEIFNNEFQSWVASHQVTPEFLKSNLNQILGEFMQSSPTTLIVLRLTQPDGVASLQLPSSFNKYEPAEIRLSKEILRHHLQGMDRLPKGYDVVDGVDQYSTDGEGVSNPFFLNNEQRFADPVNPNQVSKFLDDLGKPLPPTPEPGSLDSFLRPEGEEMPLDLAIMDMALTCIPWGVGQAYSAFQVSFGFNILLFRLSKTDRAILGAAILVPYGVKMAKVTAKMAASGGKAAVAGKGVVAMKAGEDIALQAAKQAAGASAFKNSITTLTSGAAVGTGIAEAEKAAEVAAKVASVGSHGAEIILEAARAIFRKKLSKQLAVKALSVIETMVKHNPELAEKMTKEAIEEFAKVVNKYPAILDIGSEGFAEVISVANKSNVLRAATDGLSKMGLLSRIKGNLVERIFNTKMASLAERYPPKKLIEWFARGKVIQGRFRFIPGHLLSDLEGRALTDGVFAVTTVVEEVKNGVIVVKKQIRIFAIFEMKSSMYGVTETVGSMANSINDVAPTARVKLAEAGKDLYKKALESAASKGEKLVKTEMDFVDEAFRIWRDKGSQIARDCERLRPANGETRRLLIAGEEGLSGALKDVSAAAIEEERGYEVILDDGIEFFGVGPGDIGGIDNIVVKFSEATSALAARGFKYTYWPLEIELGQLELVVEDIFKLLKLMKW